MSTEETQVLAGGITITPQWYLINNDRFIYTINQYLIVLFTFNAIHLWDPCDSRDYFLFCSNSFPFGFNFACITFCRSSCCFCCNCWYLCLPISNSLLNVTILAVISCCFIRRLFWLDWKRHKILVKASEFCTVYYFQLTPMGVGLPSRYV